MRVRSLVSLTPKYQHDCERCVLVGHLFGKRDRLIDVYLCIPTLGGDGSIIHRRSNEPSDYSSFPLRIEGEPDPTRKRLSFHQIRTIERAMLAMQFLCRSYEEAINEGEQAQADEIIAFMDQYMFLCSRHLQDGTLTEGEIWLASYTFDTDVGRRFPVVYTPHEHTTPPSKEA